ncbi:venom carboxylesterase-6-like isoform X1 [Schistocerca serialis cubense]|uniref:venom carboxylesterase-6-like isoform X1 n=2 Tax=Schistocerca serialis cubense TaxID=2023355 RepID=UPI00214DF5F0|nr:venom carboxylesterase-6-like isoform X1 [Schistocerca serialis cubense]
MSPAMSRCSLPVLLLLLLSLLKAAAASSARPVVHVEQGALRGVTLRSSSGRPFFAFRGVPYARPPVGKLRFQEPEPMKSWMGVWDAENYGSPCIQYVFIANPKQSRIVGDEDCLHLNVFTPKLPSADNPSSLFDVFVYIHGGGFMSGAGSYYGPEHLMDRDVVVVTINYRLGILGFLSMEHELLPGNNGLKDQSMALSWIKKNIERFGGNPESITISGTSAGGASVHFHYLSPYSKGLFQKGMSFSGSSLVPWAITEGSREKSDKLVSLVGCEAAAHKDILKCLKSRPARQLVEMTKHFQVWRYNPFTPFGPTVEIAGKKPFLSKHPAHLITEGSVQDLPWLTSVTTEEGLYPAADFVTKHDVMKELDARFEEVSAYLLDYNYTAPQEIHHEIGKKVRKHYLGEKKISTSTAAEVIQLFGDRIFVVEVERAARLQASINKSPVYFYVFGYRGKYSFSESMAETDVNLGVSHADDTAYIMNVNDIFGLTPLETKEDRKMMNIMLDMCINFSKTGNPAPVKNLKWPTVKHDSKNIPFIRISSSKSIIPDSSADLGNREFWDSLGIQEPQIQLKMKQPQDEL